MPKSLLAFALLLAACGTWTKPGATPDQLTADETACNQQALAQAPPDMTSMAEAGPGPNAPGYSCTSHGCVPSTNSLPGTGLDDRNAAQRSVLFSQCMEQHGWSQ
jgi:hypothetical protein